MIDLLSILAERGLIKQTDITAIQEEAEQAGEPIESVLLRHGISSSDILTAKGDHWQVPTKELSGESVPFETLQYIPEESAKYYRTVPLGVVDGALEVGIVDPDNIEALDALNFISAKNNIPFKVFLISEEDFNEVLKSYQGLSGTVSQALNEMGTDAPESEKTKKVIDLSAANVGDDDDAGGEDDLEASVQRAEKAGGKSSLKEEAPVTKIVATLLRSASEGRASDIHIEPTREKVRVRFRVDGVLHTSIILPIKVQRAVVARIKILASIKLDERRKPQDGRFSATIGGRKIDFRVSTFPTHFGEKVVMRILDSERNVGDLSESGFAEEQLQAIRAAVQKPYGMILITGPTGSGKSTTLYGMLGEIDRDGKNVLSLEDPVEYNIPGVSQSQVRPEIGYTFASGLRSVLRQDPDVIMVGEIRDKETAQLAVQAALTGHMVLSTLHTNNSAGAIPRLVDMGVDPYLIAPTLELVIAQRLVRRLCPDTGREIPVRGLMKKSFDEQFADLPPQYKAKLPPIEKVYGIEPTGQCPTGTRGRIGVFETLVVNEAVEQAILESADETKIYEIARQHGMITMKEDAILKATRRIIPYEEINTLGGDVTEGEAETEPIDDMLDETVLTGEVDEDTSTDTSSIRQNEVRI